MFCSIIISSTTLTFSELFRLWTIKGKIVIIIINLIKWDVATLLRSDFSSSAKINKGPKAPGAAEKIDVFSP